MGARFCAAAWMGVLLYAAPVRADLKPAKAEPNLEKRSKLALDNAAAALKHAREAYRKGEMDETRTLAAEAVESVELAESSLRETGKDPRRSPKWFKRAELETRELGRKVETFQSEMSYTDRPLLDKLHTKVQQVHDDLLTGLMEGKKRK
jgi:hypothetical protein